MCIRDRIKKITSEVAKRLAIEGTGEGDKVKALDTAVKNLVNFVEKGGEVEFVIPSNEESEDEADEFEDLRVSFREIRLLEQKIALLEHEDS